MQATRSSDSGKTPSENSFVPGKERTRTTSTCWICGSDDTFRWKERSAGASLQPSDVQITDYHYGRTLSLLKCRQCDFIFAEGEDLARLTALYEQLTDLEYELTQDSRLLQFRWLLDKVRRQVAPALPMLDIRGR